jgi:uncharacterized membrane protein/mono/diheme cytochrome c family protein
VNRLAGGAVGLFLIVLAMPALSAPALNNSEELAGQVHALFAVKCVECHGADLERPKGTVSYVLDLARVAANPKMIVPGKPLQSELYQLVLHNEMPDPKGDVPPLTPAQKNVVKEWIEDGAPAGVSAVNDVGNRPLTLGRRIIRDVGQFHPLSSHFPIALLIVALPAELLCKRTRKDSWKAVVRYCVMLGAAGAVLTATLGWCDAPSLSFTGTSAWVLFWHRWFGTATAIWAVLTAVLCELAHRRGNPPGLRSGFRLALVAGILLVSVAGYLGASLIYGLNHYTW